MTLKDSNMTFVKSFVEAFDDEDRIVEGMAGLSNEEIKKSYDTFKGVRVFSVNDGDGFLILEIDQNIGAFHMFIKKEKRNIENARKLLKLCINTLKGLGVKHIFTAAKGRNAKLLKFYGKFKIAGSFRDFLIFKLKEVE